MAVTHFQVMRFGRFAHHGIGAAFAGTERIKGGEILFGYRQDVTLLGLVTPDFQRTHARLGIGNVAQLEAPATVPVLDQLRQGIGEPTGTDVMNKADGVGFTQRPATVDHLLGTPLDLGVTALYRSEVEIST